MPLDDDSISSNGHAWAEASEIARLDERIDSESRLARQDVNELLHRNNRLEALVNRYDGTVMLVTDKLYQLEQKLVARWNKSEQRVTRLQQMVELLLKERGIPLPPPIAP
jgi:DNA repair exonuclease SbcCD ATPase subunit